MASLLRQPLMLRLSRCSHTQLRPRPLTFRPASLPRHLYARNCARSYATRPNGGPDRNDKQDVTSNEPAKGMEHLYNPKTPLTNDNRASLKKSSPEPPSMLTPQEEQAVIKGIEWVKQTAPAYMTKDLDHLLPILRKNGLTDEHRQIISELKKGSSVTPSLVMKIFRLTTSLAKQVAETYQENHTTQTGNATSPPEKPEQKAGAHDPGPSPASDSSSKQQDPKKKPQAAGGVGQPTDWMTTFIGTVVISLVLNSFLGRSDSSSEVSWQEFRNNMLSKGLVEKLVVHDGTKVRVYLNQEAYTEMYPESAVARNKSHYYYYTIGSVETFERKLDDAQRELGIPSSESLPVQYVREPGSWIPTVLTIGVNLAFLYLFFSMRKGMGGGAGGGGGIFGMGKSRAKKFNHETDIKVKFADVAGMDEAKEEIMEFVKFLKDPGHYQKLGAKIPRGAILSGPPGTGKTLLAKATAGESGVPFFSVSGSEFVEMFVGVGASRVRDLFANARKNTPCIIFIDEIDAIGRSRSKNNMGGGNDEREATLNQILTEMDGFNTSDQVVVLAGTNRRDVLDSALLRPGRFDRHIDIDKPTMEGRKQIFTVHLKNIITKLKLDEIDGRLAALTPGFSGADIANCVNEAALIAARSSAESVDMTHFEQAIERVIGGLEKRSLVLSQEEKRVVAYHEAGHAICGWYFKYADPLLKVSIIPRGQGALGYAQYLPAGDTFLMNVKQMMDRMAMTLAGRVSEELHFDTVTSGASDDFNKVTRMSRAMVTRFGMSEKIGHLFYDEDGQQSFQKPYSEAKAAEIDEEVKRIIGEAYKQCKDLLVEKKKEIGLVAEALLKKEMLTRDDLVEILGPRPFEEKGDFAKYFGSRGDRNGPGGGFDPAPTESGPPPELNPGGPGPAPAICDGKAAGTV